MKDDVSLEKKLTSQKLGFKKADKYNAEEKKRMSAGRDGEMALSFRAAVVTRKVFTSNTR